MATSDMENWQIYEASLEEHVPTATEDSLFSLLLIGDFEAETS